MYKIVLNWHKIQKPRALGQKCACTKSATGQPLRFFATQFLEILWSVVHRQVVLATVKGIWGVTHFQEENSGFIPVFLSLPLNWNRVPAIFFHTPYEARHSRMIGKAWSANLFKLRWNWQQKRAPCFARLTIHESNLSCNKSGFCSLHKAVELLTNSCDNFSQQSICCKTGGTRISNGTQYPKFGPVSALVSN